jgi:hypothetical protein
MTEQRTHVLSDEELREFAGMIAANGALAAAHPGVLLAALPSRQPVDPDAGLGVWTLDEDGDLTVNGRWFTGSVRDNEGWRALGVDAPAVRRAILAAAKAIKLARLLKRHDEGPGGEDMGEVYDLAAEVIAIADGKEVE